MTRHYKLKSKSGFSIVELLISISIISLLASLTLSSIRTTRRNSRDMHRISDLNQIQNALELYFDQNGSQYPQANTNCNTPATTADDENYGLQTLVNKGYIPQIPRDPHSSCYVYATLTAPANGFHLGATLEDTENSALGGDSDLTDGSGVTNAFNGTGVGCLPPNSGTPFGQEGNTETCYDILK